MKKSIGILFLVLLLAFSSVNAAATPLPIGEVVSAEMNLYEESAAPMVLAATDPIEEAALLIEEGIRNMEEEIVIFSSGIAVENLGTAMQRVMNRNPRFFYVKTSYGYRPVGNYVYSVVLTYTMTAEEKIAADLQIDAEIEKAVATTHSSMSDAEKALAAHDYICKEFEYEYDVEYTEQDGVTYVVYSNYDLYSFIRDRQGVCQAYAYLYMVILEEMGISCEFVPSNSMKHAWNLVEIDGEWYHVDVTYDDPMYDLLGLAYHKYFLLDDETIQSEGYDHTGYVASTAADDNSYVNRAWTSTRSPFVNIDGVWYTGGYENNTTYLYTYDFASDTLTEVYEATPWTAFTGGWWPNSYMGIFEYEDTVIFNQRDGFYQYDPESGATKKIYAIEEEGAWVYGSRLSGDTVWYCMTTSPNHGHVNPDAPDAYQVYSLDLSEITPRDAVLYMEVGVLENSAGGTVTIENGTYTGAARVLVAGYDGDNRLVDLSVSPVELSLRGVQDKEFTLSGSGIERVKAMLFTTDGITPLAISVE